MERKEIQTLRMKGYFIQATKEILKGEGLRGISVRNIAEQAGYSYATLYNYFNDVKDLIFVCVKDFQNECAEFIRMETEDEQKGIEKIKSITKAYTKFFIQYPGIFELFFIEGLSDMSNRKSDIKLIYTFLERQSIEEWRYCVENKVLSKDDTEVLKDQINYVIIGLLLYYLNRRYPDTYKKFMDLVDI
jgi:AcrR family transcriptional regulator